MKSPRHPDQRGAVLLLALLAASLIFALLTTVLWRQSGLIRIESAERERQQGQWLLLGAMDWARLILREDARTGSADHLSEPWAVPLQEGRLSSFLSAQPGASTESIDPALADQVFLSGRIEDAQGRFNLTNLLRGSEIDTLAVSQLSRLFVMLGLPPEGAPNLADNLRQAQDAKGNLFRPRTIEDLAAWGWPSASIARLRTRVVILPERSTLNVNTASPEVLAASVSGMDLSRAQQLVQTRLRSPWTQIADAQQAIGSGFDAGLHGINSQYFLLDARLRMGQTPLNATALVKRDNAAVVYQWVLPQNFEAQP
jgi:general secretion pathway protein K